MSFFTQGVGGRAQGVSTVNAEMQDDEIVLKKYYDIGTRSVSTKLVVPVVRDADRNRSPKSKRTYRSRHPPGRAIWSFPN